MIVTPVAVAPSSTNISVLYLRKESADSFQRYNALIRLFVPFVLISHFPNTLARLVNQHLVLG
jgi:hypothetical protein